MILLLLLLMGSALAETPAPTWEPTPKPVPAGLDIACAQYSSNSELLLLKDRLFKLGYYISKVPNEILLSPMLDDYTMLAVQQACRKNGLEWEIQDSGITRTAWDAIMNGNIVAADATEAPQAQTYAHIYWNEQSDAVSRIQEKLQSLGYGAGMTRGLYDEALRQALDSFCALNNISYDQNASNGIEPWLQQLLLEENSVAFHTPAPDAEPTAAPTAVPGRMESLRRYFSGSSELLGLQIPTVVMWLFSLGIIACIVIIAIHFFTPSEANVNRPGSDRSTRRPRSAGQIEFLVEYNGLTQTYRCSIDHALKIGRNVGDFPLDLHDTLISRKHCEIYYSNRSLMLRDYSSNGTRVNGKDCSRGEYALHSGDLIQIGRHNITIKF
ncbi:MAG: FHA domain-containing protein [Candidatus Faecivicinus sp.]